jgi:hypothetical protein
MIIQRELNKAYKGYKDYHDLVTHKLVEIGLDEQQALKKAFLKGFVRDENYYLDAAKVRLNQNQDDIFQEQLKNVFDYKPKGDKVNTRTGYRNLKEMGLTEYAVSFYETKRYKDHIYAKFIEQRNQERYAEENLTAEIEEAAKNAQIDALKDQIQKKFDNTNLVKAMGRQKSREGGIKNEKVRQTIGIMGIQIARMSLNSLGGVSSSGTSPIKKPTSPVRPNISIQNLSVEETNAEAKIDPACFMDAKHNKRNVSSDMSRRIKAQVLQAARDPSKNFNKRERDRQKVGKLQEIMFSTDNIFKGIKKKRYDNHALKEAIFKLGMVDTLETVVKDCEVLMGD